MLLKKNKSAQIGDTLTWVITTLIIITIGLFSIYAVSPSSFFKADKDIVFSYTYDRLMQKSIFSFLLTPTQSGEIVFGQILSSENLDSFSGTLAQKIFIDNLDDNYDTSWVFLNTMGPAGNYISNLYFQSIPSVSMTDPLFPYLTQIVLKLNQNIRIIFDFKVKIK